MQKLWYVMCALLMGVVACEDPTPPDCDADEELEYDYYSDTYSCVPRPTPQVTLPDPDPNPDPGPGVCSPPSAVSLNVPLIQQQTPVWCWLAVSEMSIRYRNYGMSLDQCEMLTIGYFGYYDTYCCYYPQDCLVTGNWQTINNLLLYVGGIGTSQWSPPADPWSLYDYLSNDFPVIAQIRSGVTGTHVVVITGMTFDCDAFGNIIPYVTVNDPLAWTGRLVAYDTFRNYWIDSMVVGY